MSPPDMGAAALPGRRHEEATPRKLSAAHGSSPRRQTEAFEAAAWEQAASELRLGSAARLIVGQLAGRADRKGQVHSGLADIATATCLPMTKVRDVLVSLSSHGFLGQRDRAFVLIVPGRAGDPG